MQIKTIIIVIISFPNISEVPKPQNEFVPQRYQFQVTVLTEKQLLFELQFGRRIVFLQLSNSQSFTPPPRINLIFSRLRVFVSHKIQKKYYTEYLTYHLAQRFAPCLNAHVL